MASPHAQEKLDQAMSAHPTRALPTRRLAAKHAAAATSAAIISPRLSTALLNHLPPMLKLIQATNAAVSTPNTWAVRANTRLPEPAPSATG